jgi:hypothetical protein
MTELTTCDSTSTHYDKHYKNYYVYNNVFYCLTFPKEWASSHLPNSGPSECELCQKVGFWNGAFIGYCVKCADIYNFERGMGFIDIGEENIYENYYIKQKKEKNPIKIDKNTFMEKSAFSTYLKNVNPDDIGNKEICDSLELISKKVEIILAEKERKLKEVLRKTLYGEEEKEESHTVSTSV